MQLSTTYRGLTEPQAAEATQQLERSTHRLTRLLTAQTLLRVVIDGAPPEHAVTLVTNVDGAEFSAQDSGHDLAAAISTALERLRVQIVRHRDRRDSLRHRIEV